VAFECHGSDGAPWLVDVVGTFGATAAGLRRTDVLHAALGRAAIAVTADPSRLLLLGTDLPADGSPGDAAIRAVRGSVVFDAIEMLSGDGIERLAKYATGVAEPAEPYLAGADHGHDPLVAIRRHAPS
jgi:hypothetical protein